jgi:hypothetical protein
MRTTVSIALVLACASVALAEEKETYLFQPGKMDEAQKAESVVASSQENADIAELASFKKAKSVTLADCPKLTDDGLAHLGKLGGLKSLTIRDCKGITDEGVLAAAKQVRELRLEGVPITDDVVRRLAPTGPLRQLALTKTEATDKSIAELVKRKTLTELTLEGDGFTDAGVATLGELTTLTDLFVECTNVGDGALAAVAKLPNLARLHWGHVSSLEPLGGKSSLSELSFGCGENVPFTPAATLKNLTSFGVVGPFADADVSHLSGLAKLRRVFLRKARLTTSGIQALAKLPALKDLTLLSFAVDKKVSLAALSGSSIENLRVGDEALDDLKLAELGGMTTLLDLDVQLPAGVTRSGLVELKRLKQLKRLFVWCAEGSPIRKADIEGLRKALPKCEVSGRTRD